MFCLSAVKHLRMSNSPLLRHFCTSSSLILLFIFVSGLLVQPAYFKFNFHNLLHFKHVLYTSPFLFFIYAYFTSILVISSCLYSIELKAQSLIALFLFLKKLILIYTSSYSSIITL